jgi:hypothetical protein
MDGLEFRIIMFFDEHWQYTAAEYQQNVGLKMAS